MQEYKNHSGMVWQPEYVKSIDVGLGLKKYF